MMNMKGWAITMGVGAAVGAVAVMMLPKECTARKLAHKAADAVEDTTHQLTQKLTQKMDM